jgi:salicylate hydroxylase
VGADGLWSAVRTQLLHDAPPRASGHVAYRALVLQTDLPAHLRSANVTLWLAPKLHMVHYPVRGGDWLNLVVVVEGESLGHPQSWDHPAQAAVLQEALVRAQVGSAVQDIVWAVQDWRLWPLHARLPMRGAHELAQGRVALLGDAAHPMLPYLAQGAGMAIEDAAALAEALSLHPGAAPQALQHYAKQRWQRNARVQARAWRNGRIFHASGPLAWGRDLALRWLGQRLLEVPWLYRGG